MIFIFFSEKKGNHITCLPETVFIRDQSSSSDCRTSSPAPVIHHYIHFKFYSLYSKLCHRSIYVQHTVRRKKNRRKWIILSWCKICVYLHSNQTIFVHYLVSKVTFRDELIIFEAVVAERFIHTPGLKINRRADRLVVW